MEHGRPRIDRRTVSYKDPEMAVSSHMTWLERAAYTAEVCENP